MEPKFSRQQEKVAWLTELEIWLVLTIHIIIFDHFYVAILFLIISKYIKWQSNHLFLSMNSGDLKQSKKLL